MSESPAPSPYTPTPTAPNSACFLNPNATTLSLATASRYFFLKTGDYANYVNSALYQLSGSQILMSALTSVTAGTASASKALVLDSSLNITNINNITSTGTLTLTRAGSQLSINNGANSGLIEVSSSPNTLRLVNGFAMNIGSAGVTVASASTAAARYALDMQATTGDIKLCLYQLSGAGTYGFGANSSALLYCSGGTGHKFYKSTTGGVLSTLQAEIDTNSNFIASNNLISGTGAFFRQGFSSAGRTNTGLAMHMANSTFAEFFSYDYAGAAFKDILIADTLLVQGGVKNVGIGIANPASDVIAYPFVVNKTINSSVTSYGYLSQSTVGNSAGSTGSVGVSIYASGRIWATEFDAYSDRRVKKEIEKIDASKADEFIDKVEPVEYSWKDPNEAGRRTGYIAQQLLSTGLFEDLVTYHVDDKMKSDDSGSPEGYSLTIQYNNVIAILHQALKNQREIIRENQKKINELELKLNELSPASAPGELLGVTHKINKS